MKLNFAAVALIVTLLDIAQIRGFAQGLTYPEARKADQVDDYHGARVPDPYRWLEDDRSPETAAWVKAENQVTADYLSRIPYRSQLMKRLEQLQNYPRYTPPLRRGNITSSEKMTAFRTRAWFTFSKASAGHLECYWIQTSSRATEHPDLAYWLSQSPARMQPTPSLPEDPTGRKGT